MVKDEGGAIGILHSPKALIQWMLAGPEISRMISEFGNVIEGPSGKYITSHHEDTVSFEKKFRKDVKSLYSAYIEDGNPFEEEDGVLTKLGNKVVMNEDVIKSVCEAQKSARINMTFSKWKGSLQLQNLFLMLLRRISCLFLGKKIQ